MPFITPYKFGKVKQKSGNCTLSQPIAKKASLCTEETSEALRMSNNEEPLLYIMITRSINFSCNLTSELKHNILSFSSKWCYSSQCLADLPQNEELGESSWVKNQLGLGRVIVKSFSNFHFTRLITFSSKSFPCIRILLNHFVYWKSQHSFKVFLQDSPWLWVRSKFSMFCLFSVLPPSSTSSTSSTL